MGQLLQTGLQRKIDKAGAQSYASLVLPLADARKVFLLNRGVWDAIATAGPSVSYAIDRADIDTYVNAAGDFLHELTR